MLLLLLLYRCEPKSKLITNNALRVSGIILYNNIMDFTNKTIHCYYKRCLILIITIKIMANIVSAIRNSIFHIPTSSYVNKLLMTCIYFKL